MCSVLLKHHQDIGEALNHLEVKVLTILVPQQEESRKEWTDAFEWTIAHKGAIKEIRKIQLSSMEYGFSGC